MVYFQTKNPDLGKFWMALEWKMLVYFMTIWDILGPLGIIYCHLVWYSLWSFGTFFPFWYVWNTKNLATLALTQIRRHNNKKTFPPKNGSASISSDT
jgi:hypothetical protein